MPASDRDRFGSRWWQTLALMMAHAVLFILAFPPFYLYPTIVLAIACLTLGAVRSGCPRRAAVFAAVTSVAMWAWFQWWMIDVTTAGMPLLCLYMALYSVLFIWIISRVARRRPLWPMTIVVPIAWVGLEMLRGEVFMDGYPWYLAVHPFLEAPLVVQSADLVSGYGVSFLVAMWGGLIVDLVRWHGSSTTRRRRAAWLAAVVVISAANLVYGLIQVTETGRNLSDRHFIRVLALQTNLPQSNKIGWTPEEQRRDVQRFITETRQLAAADHDLIVWPETMLPGWGLDAATLATLRQWQQNHPVTLAEAAVSLSRKLDTPLLVGAPAYDGLRAESAGDDRYRFAWDAHYNSAYLLEPDRPAASQRYDKVFLTPFGETMPYISAWPWLEEQLLALGASGMSFDLDAAVEPQLIEVSHTDRFRDEPMTSRIATPICFEDTSGALCREMAYKNGIKRIDAFVNISNDGWFGDGHGRAQHAQIARLRCIENRVPMIRSSNTGHSVAYDSAGILIARIGSGRYGESQVSGSIEADLFRDDRATLFGRVGHLVGWLCLGGMVLIALSTFRRKRDAT